ncbi:MAG: hypothetical protein COA34_008900 [Methylophaga sp.]|uniref:hypothetical protein n=1 Tax=Methylophaga sp. TaxID=2024840 RepID=UPI000C114E5A|nr:hypothetical protein [Methylophaga sp.]MBL1457965.1 hypothetical protein [Methylophaga sp.]
MSKYIKKNDLLPLLECHFHENLTNSEYEVLFKPASELLTWNRLDLAFKLLYLEHKSNCITFAEEIYREHIEALTLGSYKEPGNSEKNSAQSFIDEFEHTFHAISSMGFDQNQSIIPLSSGSIVNGAHRIASAIVAGKPVACVNIETEAHCYDYKFFYNRNVRTSSIEAAVSQFIEKAPNVHIALIWPSAIGHEKELISLIPNIIYRKDINLTGKGAKNLLINVYHSESWLGSYVNQFKGVQGKLVECFKTTNPLRAIAFQANTHEEVLLIKEKIRALYKLGKHSIHTTDTATEALRVSRILFNDNGVHFLNYAEPYKYSDNFSEIKKVHQFLKYSGLKPDDILIDGSLILSLYGIRKNQDIDYLTVREVIKETLPILNINNHNEEAHYHGQEKNTLIANPKFHFYYEGIKFISFEQLYKMKKNRGEIKDINDCNMMDSLIENKWIRVIFHKVRQNIFYLNIKLKVRLITILQNLRIYNTLKKLIKKS